MLPELSVIVVNYNTADLVGACLDSIQGQSEQVKKVIVVDNNSADGSAELISRSYPWVHLIANSRNTGFSAANNQALEYCSTALVFFLNPDTVIHQNCLRELRMYMADNPHIGLAGVATCNQEGKSHQTVEYTYPGKNYTKGYLDRLPGDIAWVLGAGMAARMDILRRLNGFDERFFLYAEDIDLCLRVRQAGWELGYMDKAMITHIEGQSERGVDYYRVTEKKTHAELMFFKKHYPGHVVQKICRARRVQAIWRILCLNCFPGSSAVNREKNKEKLAKYRAVYTVFSGEGQSSQ